MTKDESRDVGATVVVGTNFSSIHPSSAANKLDKVMKLIGIYSLFILRESGCPFFSRIYDARGGKTDPAILGGFFTALALFAKEVTPGQIETVTAGPCRYTFQHLSPGLLVICSSKNFSLLVLDRIIKRISQLVLSKYEDRLQGIRPAALCAPDLEDDLMRIFQDLVFKTDDLKKIH